MFLLLKATNRVTWLAATVLTLNQNYFYASAAMTVIYLIKWHLDKSRELKENKKNEGTKL